MTDLIFRGVNFINSHDDGRLAQTDFDYDLLGECANPTEGGAAITGSGQSQSNLRITSVSGGFLYSASAPAYWNAPGTTHSCGVAQGVGIVSNEKIEKIVQTGFEGDPQIVHWLSNATVMEPHASLRLEAQAFYVPGNFNHYYAFNPFTAQLQSTVPAEIGIDSFASSLHQFPPIYATADGQSAIGLFAIDQEGQTPDGITRVPYYHEAKHTNLSDSSDATAKFSVYYFYTNSAAGSYQSDTYLIFGTLSEVTARMAYLHQRFAHQAVSLIVSAVGAHGFNSAYYSSYYSDIGAAFGGNQEKLLQHYLQNGIWEGRRGSATFDALNYMNLYLDLRNYYGPGNLISGLKHYLEHGLSEGRSGGL